MLMRLGRADAEPEPVPSQGPPLGLFDQPEFFPQSFSFRPRDIFLLYTDGISEASFLDTETGVRVKLSTEGLYDLVAAHHGYELDELVDKVWKDVLRFCGGKPKDDMLLLGLSIPEPQPGEE